MIAPTNLSAAPHLLAIWSESNRGVLFASAPSPNLEWMSAADWLKQWGPASVPVVPLYLGQAKHGGWQTGKPIDPAALAALPDAEEQLRYLRWRISLLAERAAFKPQTRRPLRGRSRKTRAPEPLAAAISPDRIACELAALDPASRLAASGVFEVYVTGSSAIPATLAEIGRLREIAFRSAGEGTGRAFDLDRFDHSYQHLFVWNREAREIAGAYRLALADGRPESLYTATLFHYGPEFLRRLGPAIELGRSFIRLEYQKSFAPLLLLWKGIGRFISLHPDYAKLFGPVSISNQYQSLSRELMIAFLEKRELLADLAELVRPKHAPARRASVTADYCRDLDDLSGLVADIEAGSQGVPTLLRHYLRLGGKLLGFNVDPDFANALDGLIVVDLTKTEPRLLERYLGKEEAAALLAHHHRKGNPHGSLEKS